MQNRSNLLLTLALVLALAGVLAFAVAAFFGYLEFGVPQPQGPASGEFLATGRAEGAGAPVFSFRDIPQMLYVHVAIIAALQIVAVLMAAHLGTKRTETRRDLLTIQFLCEIPMYLGLFGTLLGVCLTQFMTGSLVAPLAYLTTMSGILLHLVGKLLVWLPLAAEEERDI